MDELTTAKRSVRSNSAWGEPIRGPRTWKILEMTLSALIEPVELKYCLDSGPGEIAVSAGNDWRDRIVRAVQTFAVRPSRLDLSRLSDIFARNLPNSGCSNVNSEWKGFQMSSHIALEIMRWACAVRRSFESSESSIGTDLKQGSAATSSLWTFSRSLWTVSKCGLVRGESSYIFFYTMEVF